MTLRKEAPIEVWFGVLALAGVLFIDVLEGMMIGLLASLAFVIYRSSRPHLSSLGRVPGAPGAYSDLTRHPENSARAGRAHRAARRADVLRQRADGPRPPEGHDPRGHATAQGGRLRRRGTGRSRP